jgi:hypothetical protein
MCANDRHSAADLLAPTMPRRDANFVNTPGVSPVSGDEQLGAGASSLITIRGVSSISSNNRR